MEITRNFKEISKNDSVLAGGKGASLGEMTQAGIPVPPGFVVLSTTFDQFLHETDLTQEINAILEKVDHKEIHTVEGASEKIQGLIKNAIMPRNIALEIKKQFKKLDAKYVAVRSSATAEDGAENAWAGQLDSFLNTIEENLLEKVQFCWASLFTPRAIFYRFEKGLHTTKISVAVVVQKMVQSEVSGIAFSVHPITEDPNQLIIEAGYGLGEAIVSGSITPDSYVVGKEPREIIDKNISEQKKGIFRSGDQNDWLMIDREKRDIQKLSDERILELSELVIKIEKHYDFPCDIEWAFEKGKFYIVQSRPITTLSSAATINTEEINPEDYHFFGLWKCNLFSDWYWTKWLVPEYAQKIGFGISDGGIFVINGGYFFTKKSVIEAVRQYAKNIIESHNKEKLVSLKKLAEEIYDQSLKTVEKLSVEIPTENNFRETAEIGQHIMFPWCFGYILSEVFDEFLIPAAEKAKIKRENVSSLIPPFRTPLIEAQDNLRLIKKVLEEKGFWKVLLENSTKAIEQIKKDKQVAYLIKEHLNDHGWTAVMNLVGEDPTVEEVIDQITHIPPVNNRTDDDKVPINLTFLVECAAITAYLRQTGAEYFSIYSRHAQRLFKATAQKLDITYRELLDLNLDEIIAGINGTDVKGIIKKRIGDKWAIYSMPGSQEPKIIDDPQILDHLAATMIPKAEVSNDGTITGQIGNKGVGRGKVKVILSLEDFHKMKRGDVLVTTMTTPDFVPLMQKSAAIITNIGGLLCHAAIISRELNIPCVIGTKFATQIFKDGDEVEVDANSGVVRIIEQETEDGPKDKILKYLKTHKMDIQHAKASLFAIDLVYLAYVESHDVHGIKFTPVLAHVKNGSDFFQIIPDENIMGVARKIYKDYLADEESLDERIKTHIKIKIETDKLWENYKKKTDPTDKELLQFFRDLIKLSQDWWHYGVIGEDKGRIVDEEIVPLFEKNHKIDKNRAHEIISNLSHPEEQAAFSLERKNFYDMCLYILSANGLKKAFIDKNIAAIKKDKEFIRKFEKYQNNYFYKNTDFFDRKELTLESVVSELKSEIHKNSKAEINKEILDIENASKEIKKNKKELLSSIKFTTEEKKLIQFASKTVSWVDERKVGMMKQMYYVFSLLHEIAERNNMSYEDAAALTVLEIEDLLTSKKRIDSKEVGERKKSLMTVHETGEKIKIYYGEDSIEMFNLAKGVSNDSKELKGSVASRGNGSKVTGVVRIITDPVNDLFKKGEILVTSMTRIEFVPLMKKAKMIITNEGGIACHAAIVSRELGVPCIIGTKNATEILGDGDTIEADIEKGLIVVIKKNEN